jgi:hypothetical protein
MGASAPAGSSPIHTSYTVCLTDPTALGLIAGVLVVSALAAGLVERTPLSFPML